MTHEEAEQEIRSHLEPGETLLWSGVPLQGVFLRPRDTWVIPFTVLWAVFAFVFLGSVLAPGTPPALAFAGIFFAIAGVALNLGRLPLEARIRSLTSYGLTDRRVLVVGGNAWRGRPVRSLPLRELPGVSLHPESGGAATILFDEDDLVSKLGRGPAYSPGLRNPPSVGFECLVDAEKVLALVRDARERALGARPVTPLP